MNALVSSLKEDAKVATPDITFLKDEELLEDEAVKASSVMMIGAF